jgi:hypothetical protein
MDTTIFLVRDVEERTILGAYWNQEDAETCIRNRVASETPKDMEYLTAQYEMLEIEVE